MRLEARLRTAGVLAGWLLLAVSLATGCGPAGANAAAPPAPTEAAPLEPTPAEATPAEATPPSEKRPPEPAKQEALSGECELPAGLELALLFELAKGPAALSKLRAGIETVRPGAALQCGDGRRGYVLLRRQELERLLGKAAEFSCVSGAGNVAGKNSYRARLVPPGYVPPSLSGAVVRLGLDDDPKFLLAGATRYRPCTAE